MKSLLFAGLLLSSSVVLASCETPHTLDEKHIGEMKISQPSFKVAYLGDSGYNENFENVLKLVKKEKAELVVHLGDLAYDEENVKSPKAWEDVINKILGEHYPYLFLVGNHEYHPETDRWYQKNPEGYSLIYKRRLTKNSELRCDGDPGVMSTCTFRDLYFVVSGIGVKDGNHEEYISQALNSGKDHVWKICAWHKNQHEMQTGWKDDEVGWEAYKICQKHGAMIGTGHEHTYARTRMMNDVGNSSKNHGAFGSTQEMVLKNGQTFAFVSALGGNSLRNTNCEIAKKDWWASVYGSNFLMQHGVIKHESCEDDHTKDVEKGDAHHNYGVLFIEYYHKKNPRFALAQFKTVDGQVIDEFTIEAKF